MMAWKRPRKSGPAGDPGHLLTAHADPATLHRGPRQRAFRLHPQTVRGERPPTAPSKIALYKHQTEKKLRASERRADFLARGQCRAHLLSRLPDHAGNGGASRRAAPGRLVRRSPGRRRRGYPPAGRGARRPGERSWALDCGTSMPGEPRTRAWRGRGTWASPAGSLFRDSRRGAGCLGP